MTLRHYDNAALSIRTTRSRNRRHRYGMERRNVTKGTYGVTCICAITVDKSVEKSSRKSRWIYACMHTYACICRQYLAHVFHIKVFLNLEQHDDTCESKIQLRSHSSVSQQQFFLFAQNFSYALENNCCSYTYIYNSVF